MPRVVPQSDPRTKRHSASRQPTTAEAPKALEKRSTPEREIFKTRSKSRRSAKLQGATITGQAPLPHPRYVCRQYSLQHQKYTCLLEKRYCHLCGIPPHTHLGLYRLSSLPRRRALKNKTPNVVTCIDHRNPHDQTKNGGEGGNKSTTQFCEQSKDASVSLLVRREKRRSDVWCRRNVNRHLHHRAVLTHGGSRAP